MKRLEPVIWAKGTFLTPQHLQIQDRFLENTLQFQLDALSFRPWGFRQLQVNQELLPAGTFAFRARREFFPDGLLFDIPNSDPAPAPKPLAELFGSGPGGDRRVSRDSAVSRARPEYLGPDAGRRHALPGGGGNLQGREHRHIGAAGAGGAQEFPPAG